MGWTQAADAPIDLKKYQFLCDPPPNGKSPPADTSTGGGAGESDELPIPPGLVEAACPTTAFREGEVPSIDVINAYGCGTVQSTANGGEAAPLTNGVTYAVAIASVDSYLNVGPVSQVTCGTPQLVTDFYEAYREAGGKGGGGFCAIGRNPTHTLTALMALGALGLIARRRVRVARNKRSGS
jgi:hypothetical protein